MWVKIVRLTLKINLINDLKIFLKYSSCKMFPPQMIPQNLILGHYKNEKKNETMQINQLVLFNTYTWALMNKTTRL